MVEVGEKRKASRPLRECTKRTRIEPASTGAALELDDGLEHYSDDNYDDEDEDDQNSQSGRSQRDDTPITPFSPASTKFPSEEKTIKCTWEGCTKVFNRPARLQSHLRSHTNERPFKCDYPGCDKAYLERKHLIAHVKGTHTNERAYVCDRDGCGKSFLTATRLRRHQDAHDGRERFRCTGYPPCDQSFRKHQTLQRHIRSEHLNLTPFFCSHVDPITKVICNAGFDGVSALKKHVDRSHGSPRFFCDDCFEEGTTQPLGFPSQAALNKHIRTEHANCIFCDMKFSSQAKLAKHIESMHNSTKSSIPLSERKNVPCTHPGCNKKFTRKSNLDAHIRTAHNGERFICGEFSFDDSATLGFWDGEGACGKDFFSKANLEDHIRTQHLGLPSVINANRVKAPKAKKQKKEKTLIDHLTGASYAEDESRNIPCTVPGCEYRFMRQYDLQLHLRAKHDIDPLSFETISGPLFGSSFDDQLQTPPAYDQTEFDWEAEAQTSGSSSWWIGGGEGYDGGRQEDTWLQEEAEMRRLIDFNDVAPEQLQYADPAL